MQNNIELSDVSLGFKQLRKLCNLSQVELSKLTGLEQATISNIENARNFNVENFLTLYNFYQKEQDSKIVLRNLFGISV